MKSKASALYENASLEKIRNASRNSASAAWQAVPTREAVGRGARRSLDFVKGTWNDPGQAWQDVNERFDRSLTAIALISSEIAKSVEGFGDLSPAIQDQIICDGLEHFVESGAISALLAATGAGVAVATTKLTTTAIAYGKRIRSTMPLIRHINANLHLDESERSKTVRQLLNGKLSDERRKTLELSTAFTNSIARSSKVRIYNNRGNVRNHSIEPGNSYTVVLDGDGLILGHEVKGRYNRQPGGAGSHLTLLDLHHKQETPSGFAFEGGAIRFNTDGSIDVSGYRRMIASPKSEKEIVRRLKELYPTARIRSTPDRIRTLDEMSP